MNKSNQGRCDDGFVGDTLRSLRAITRMSQRELANRAGVTHSSISQIEQGLISPSIHFLHKVLCGVPMDLATFFQLDLRENTGGRLPTVSAAAALSQSEAHSGQVVSLSDGLDQFLTLLPANDFQPLQCWPCETLLWCARGDIELRSHQQSLSLHSGDAVLLQANTPFVVASLANRQAHCGVVPIDSGIKPFSGVELLDGL